MHDATPLTRLNDDGSRVLVPTERLADYREDIARLERVATVGQLLALYDEHPHTYPYASSGGISSIEDLREELDEADWEDEGVADDSPWSTLRLDDGDHPFPLPLAQLSRDWLGEDLFNDLLDRGLADYQEGWGPCDIVTIPDHLRADLVTRLQASGHQITTLGRR